MIDPKFVNIGKESPILVPADALSLNPDTQERYWRGVTSGSTLPSSDSKTDQEALTILLNNKK